MTANFQLSGKDQAGRIFVVGGENYPEFVENLSTLIDGPVDSLLDDLVRIVAPGIVKGGDGASAPPFQGAPVPQGNPNYGAQPDPYGNAYQQAPPQQEAPRQQAPEPGGPAPTCVHGPKKWVPGGFSQRTQKAYQGFWACPAPKGQQCR